jgi:TatD DNase family protein
LRPKPESRRNEPAYLPHILSAIAAARGETADSLAERTTQNALTLFGWK